MKKILFLLLMLTGLMSSVFALGLTGPPGNDILKSQVICDTGYAFPTVAHKASAYSNIYIFHKDGLSGRVQSGKTSNMKSKVLCHLYVPGFSGGYGSQMIWDKGPDS